MITVEPAKPVINALVIGNLCTHLDQIDVGIGGVIRI